MTTDHLINNILTERNLNLPFSANHSDLATLRAQNWPLGFLTDFIVQNHHIYISDALPKIIQLMEEVVTEYGLEHPQLEEIFVTFHSLTVHFLAQMRKEEEVLFPVIKELVRASENHKDLSYFPFESIHSLVEDIEEEHHVIEEGLVALRRITNDFTVPVNVCRAYGLLFRWMEEFERDIYQHEHLENNVLFPRVLALEDAMR